MNNKLTLKKALELSIELWTWCAETGKDKTLWPGWNDYLAKNYCFLCQYALEVSPEIYNDNCRRICPLGDKIDGCYGYDWGKWVTVSTVKPRRKYAALFREELKQKLTEVEDVKHV
jgi:hypothetical protein